MIESSGISSVRKLVYRLQSETNSDSIITAQPADTITQQAAIIPSKQIAFEASSSKNSTTAVSNCLEGSTKTHTMMSPVAVTRYSTSPNNAPNLPIPIRLKNGTPPPRVLPKPLGPKHPGQPLFQGVVGEEAAITLRLRTPGCGNSSPPPSITGSPLSTPPPKISPKPKFPGQSGLTRQPSQIKCSNTILINTDITPTTPTIPSTPIIVQSAIRNLITVGVMKYYIL